MNPTTIFGLVIAYVVLVPILSFLGGALAGAILGLFFEQTIMGVLTAFGMNVQGLALWQIGGTLAFIGGFFKSVVTSK